MSTPDLGEIAYNAYAESRDWRVFNGDPMPMWYEQSDSLKAAWAAAAEAVVQTVSQ